jgi:hypothetical protein
VHGEEALCDTQLQLSKFIINYIYGGQYFLRNHAFVEVERLLVRKIQLIITIIFVIVVLLSQAFFSLVLLFSQLWTPPLRLQVSDCSTFLMMCDVPSTAFFFVENLLIVVLVFSPNIFLTFTYNSCGPSNYWYDKEFHVPYSINFYT